MTDNWTNVKLGPEPRRAVFAQQAVAIEWLARLEGEALDEFLESVRRDVGYHAGHNLLEIIADGQIYTVQIKLVERNLDVRADPAGVCLDNGPTTCFSNRQPSISYEGTVSKVHVRPYYMPAQPDLDFSNIMEYPPAWSTILDAVKSRLRRNFKPNSLAKWLLRNVAARVLYLPEHNPEYWGTE